MIPLYRKIALSEASSFSVIEEIPPLFETPWHYHPEYELILILNSSGKRFMGDNISDFDQQELVLVGSDLPHFWRSEFSKKKNEELKSRAIVIHFSEHWLGHEFFKLPETNKIREFLNLSKRGLLMGEKSKIEVCPQIIDLVASEGFDRIVRMLSILNQLCKIADYTFLSSPGFVRQFNSAQNEKINKVYEYVMNHFKEEIKLEKIARIACMEPSAFCRYFKKSTNKTFSHFLRELRIGYSCRLLIKDKISVSQICYECGFNNVSNFNRQFKEVTKLKPLEYKRKYQTNE